MWTLLESMDLDRKLATAMANPYCTLGEGQPEAHHPHLSLSRQGWKQQCYEERKHIGFVTSYFFY